MTTVVTYESSKSRFYTRSLLLGPISSHYSERVVKSESVGRGETVRQDERVVRGEIVGASNSYLLACTEPLTGPILRIEFVISQLLIASPTVVYLEQAKFMYIFGEGYSTQSKSM